MKPSKRKTGDQVLAEQGEPTDADLAELDAQARMQGGIAVPIDFSFRPEMAWAAAKSSVLTDAEAWILLSNLPPLTYASRVFLAAMDGDGARVRRGRSRSSRRQRSAAPGIRAQDYGEGVEFDVADAQGEFTVAIRGLGVRVYVGTAAHWFRGGRECAPPT